MMSRTFAGLLRELNVDVIATSKNRSRAARRTCAGRTLARIFESRGYEHLRSVLISICETRNNKRMLIEPVVWAISDVLHLKPEWLGDHWFGPARRDRTCCALRPRQGASQGSRAAACHGRDADRRDGAAAGGPARSEGRMSTIDTVEAKLRAAMRECIEALVAAGQTREQAVVQVRKIVRDEMARRRRSQFKVIK
jgi:hypothetical protein